MMRVRSLRAVGLAFLIVSVSACTGASKSEVSGKVTYKGAPVDHGEIAIKAADGTVVTGEIKQDGSYTVSNVPHGSHTVSITSIDDKAANEYFMALAGRGKTQGDPIGPDGKPRPKGSKPLDLTDFTKVPKKYSKPETSGLTVDVKESKVTKNFELTD